MSRPRFEPGLPAWEASTLEKSHLDSFYAGYSEPQLIMRLALQQQPLQYIILLVTVDISKQTKINFQRASIKSTEAKKRRLDVPPPKKV